MPRLPDRAFLAASLATAAAVFASTFFIYEVAPVEATMGIVQKIFYVHVPAALATYAGFIACAVASAIYLIRPQRRWDALARAGAEVGLLFCAYVLISGPIWGYKAWGKPWVWDPQLTATLVLFALYGGYVALRALSPDTRSMRTIAAVLGVIACVDIPLIHFAVKYWGGLHPVVQREGGGGLDPAMGSAFALSMLAFLLLFCLLYWMSARLRLGALRLDELHLEIEDLAYDRPAPPKEHP